MTRLSLWALSFLVVALLCVDVALADRDYYETLGVPRDATTKQIRKAYRDLSLKYPSLPFSFLLSPFPLLSPSF